MRILKIAYDWPPPWSGLAPHPYELSAAQARLGHEIYVYAGRWSRSGNVAQAAGLTVIPFLGSHDIPFRAPLYGTTLITIGPLILLRFLFSKIKHSIDIIHMHERTGLFILLYLKYLRRILPKSKMAKVPLVVHFHITAAGRKEKLEQKNERINFITKYLDWPLALLFDRTAVKTAEALIFVSSQAKDEAIKFYNADPSKCYVIESGVNASLFVPVGNEEKYKTRRDLQLEQHDKVLLYHGYMVPRKNIELLIETLSLLPDTYRMILSGPFVSDAYRKTIFELIEEKRLEKRILLTGYTPYTEAPIAYQAADLFLLLSKYEGTPKVVMEALSCGIPVLASGFKLDQEIEGLSYVRSLQASEIVEQVKQLMAVQVKVDRDYVTAKYSWDARARMVDQVYKKVLADAKAS